MEKEDEENLSNKSVKSGTKRINNKILYFMEAASMRHILDAANWLIWLKFSKFGLF